MPREAETFTPDESMLLMLYFHDSRTGTIISLQKMSAQLTAEETDLSAMANTLIGKLNGISDSEFLQLEPVQNVIN